MSAAASVLRRFGALSSEERPSGVCWAAFFMRGVGVSDHRFTKLCNDMLKAQAAGMSKSFRLWRKRETFERN
jgi:hypothetical protein